MTHAGRHFAVTDSTLGKKNSLKSRLITYYSGCFVFFLSSHQRHQLSLLHDGLELFAPLGAGRHLGTQQVSRGQVCVAVLLHHLLALSAFTGAGAA